MTIGFVSLAIAALAIPHPVTAQVDDKVSRVVPVPLPKPGDRLTGARLSDRERAMIFAQVKATSFDVPSNWASELVARRTKLGSSDYLIVRGSDMLCGSTGNCQTWLFRRTGRGWINAISGKPPIISSLGFRTSRGRFDLVGCRSVSSIATDCTTWHLDKGKFRRGSTNTGR